MRLSSKSEGFPSAAKVLLQVLFLFWIIAVNLLYYAQFKALLISRLEHFIDR